MYTEYEKLIEDRCEIALKDNVRYKELQKELANAHIKNDLELFSELSFKMQCIAMVVCYKLGMKDLHNVLKD